MRSEGANLVGRAFPRQCCVLQQPGPPAKKQLQPTNKKLQINSSTYETLAQIKDSNDVKMVGKNLGLANQRQNVYR